MCIKKVVSLMLVCALTFNSSVISFASAENDADLAGKVNDLEKQLTTSKAESRELKSKIENDNSSKKLNEDNEDDNSSNSENEEYKKHLEEIENLKKEVEKLKEKAEKSANTCSADAELYSRTALMIASRIFFFVNFLHTLWMPTKTFLGLLLHLLASYGFFQLIAATGL